MPLGHRLAARCPPPCASAGRSEGVLLLDLGSPLGLEGVYVQALELFLRRAGLRVLLLSADLAEKRFMNAMRALQPVAVILCGAGARLDVVGLALRKVITGTEKARLYGYRTARLVEGRRGIPALGTSPAEATDSLVADLSWPSRP